MIRIITQILKNQGLRYVAFRALYEAKRKFGMLKKQYPSNPPQAEYPSLSEWKEMKILFIIGSREEIKIQRHTSKRLAESFQKIKNGQIRYFNRDWKQVSGWLTNPDSGHKYDIKKHWTEVEDLSKEAGDIKYAWEKSRFSYLYDVIRYDYHFEKDSATFVFSEIESWIEDNPINMGPNYKCSQETSLRCLNWIFAIYFYQKSDPLTEMRWQRIMHYLYWQIKHVYANIDFSRICVRNNHAITECMMIYFGGLLFPFLKESDKWKQKGKEWLEKEIAYQIYDDGTFLQFSHNYQRVLAQLLTWTIALSKVHNESLSSVTISKAKATWSYMSRCCVGSDGQLPNYGSNDGALFFKFNDQDYSDFRPQLNALAAVLGSNELYSQDGTKEDAQWMCQNLIQDRSNIFIVKANIINYPKGGIYTINDGDSFTFFKCAAYKDRPAHADNMHLDIWVGGINYLRDSGTYKYNTEDELINYFVGTAGHNSVMIDNHNQMTKGSRFIWFDWTKKALCQTVDNVENFLIEARATMFASAGRNIEHNRTVSKTKSQFVWSIEDSISNKSEQQTMRQFWHPHPNHLEDISIIAVDEDGKSIQRKEMKGFWSEYYGEKVNVPVWLYETKTAVIKTEIKIKS
ncbi:MAG: hypothetical protein ACJATI_003686 [Halioglobus sp.]